MNKLVSIIITSYGMNDERRSAARSSLESLFKSTEVPFELILVDNGPDFSDSCYFTQLTHEGKINTYIRNHNNMHFGYARNQGIRCSNGDYIVIADNDLLYRRGWLEACLAVLEAYPEEKIYATPLYNVAHWLDKYWANRSLIVGNEEYKLNTRAGSNCFVIRRKDLEEIGEFFVHRVAGTKWTEEAMQKGYLGAVCPRLMVEDIGFRRGYNYKEALPVKIRLQGSYEGTWKEVYLNRDEFRRENSGLPFINQGKFNPKEYKTFV